MIDQFDILVTENNDDVTVNVTNNLEEVVDIFVAEAGEEIELNITNNIVELNIIRGAVNLSLTTNNNSGPATYDNITGVLNIPIYAPDLSGYVPYTGATESVNLGVYNITPAMVYISGAGTGGGGVLNLKKDTTRTIGGDDAANTISIWAEGTSFGFNDWVAGNIRNARFSVESITNNATRTYILPNANGTLALTSDLHAPVTIGTANGLNLSGQQLSLGIASGSANGALSSTDWTTFNNKQNALTNPITGTGASGQVAFWNGTNTQTGDSGLFWDNVNKRLGVGGTPGDFRLDVNGTARVQGALTVSTGGAQITGALQVLTGGEVITGNSRIITGQTGLTLGGNSDVQTLTENTNKRARINVPQYGTSSSTPIGIIQANANVSSNSIHIGGIQSGYSLAADEISFFIGATYNATTANQIARFFSTGNLVLQNGGTFTDAGFRLDVNGTARLNGLTTIQGTTASDTAPLGAELLTTGTGDASWTGTSFATGYTHVAGSVTTLTSAVAAVINTYYQITYTVTGRTAGSFTIAFGGNTTSGITATGATGPMATITGSLIITPTTDFNGTIVLSIRTIGTSSATTTFNDSTGVVRGEIRASTRGMFIGTNSGRRNTTGSNNSAFLGLRENTTGVENSAFGVASLINNNIGSFNSAFGVAALQSNRSGNRNNAFGAYSLFANVTGTNNQAFGNEALVNNTANNNQAFGSNSLEFNTTGSNNIAIGHFAGRSIADSLTANTITNSSIYIGASTKALADNQTNQIVIGHNATGLGSNTTVLGNALTLSTAIYGDLLLGQTTDNGTDRLQITGTARVSSSITAGSFIRSGGTSSQYLMADGSVSTLSNPITGTGTTNFLPKFTGGSTLGNSLIFDNGTNVGIGTTSPISKLHVNGDMRTVLTSGVGGDTLIAAINGVSNGYLINVDTSNNITHTWHTGGNIPSMRITSSGNVGIGTTSPSARLSVANAVTTTATVMAIGTFNNGLNFIINSNGSPEIASSAAVAPIHFSQGSTRVMTLSDNGNVGIGTTTPTALLHVNGQGRFYSNSSSTPALIVAGAGGVDNTNQGELRFGDAGNIYKIQGGEDYGAMNFITNNLPRLVIAANGNVGIGTTFPEAILDVASPTNRASMYISNTATSGTDNISEFRLNGWNGTSTSIIGQVIGTDSNITTATANAIIIRASRGSGVIRFDTGGNNERMRIDASGNLGIGITNPAYRLDVNGLINSTNGISVGGEGVSRFWTGTQAQYDAITTKVSTTVYLIT